MNELDQAIEGIEARMHAAQQEPDDSLRFLLTSLIKDQAAALRRLNDERKPGV